MSKRNSDEIRLEMTIENEDYCKTATDIASEDNIPPERQCVQFDLNDPDMDLLEKTARRIIPIPQAYYFETGNTNIPLKTKAWHRSVQTLGMLLRWSEKIGQGVAKLTGLDDSRFEDITATMNSKQWDEAQRNAEDQKEKREKYLQSVKEQQIQEEILSCAGLSSQAL